MAEAPPTEDREAFALWMLRRRRARRAGKGGPHRHWLTRVLLVVVLVFVLVAAAAIAVAAGVVLAATRNLPSLDSLHSQINGQTSTIYDSSGHVIAELHGDQNRTVVTSQAIPTVMKEATVASEDQRFYEESYGIDFIGLARAALADLKAGAFVEGASTITQQYVKNAYVGSERTITRKIREAVLAWELAGKWSKDKILTAYLNTVYYGRGAYGVEAGAETYFHEHARQLKLPQAALLVAIAKLPTDYDPVLYPQVARTIRNQVLDKMVSQGYITLAQASAAKAAPIKVFAGPPSVSNSDQASYFVEYVTQLLVAKYGYAEVFEGGLHVYTSLNSAWQADAYRVVKSTVSPLNFGFKPSAALVAIDPQTGYIRAMVGGLDFKKQQFNLATQAYRQPGSSMKPFVLAAAIEKGMNPDTTYYSSHSPITIPLGLGAAPWVVNGDGPGGLESVTNATVISDNVVFAQLSVDVGPANTVAVAHAMGITSSLDAVPSITLGTSSVTPLELADAYATFASGGIHHAPQAIVKVLLPNGKTDWQPSTAGNRAIPAGVAATVNRVLEKVASYGTGSSTGAYFPYPRAGKTGTTDLSWDVWYSGFTPQLAASVWMGNIVRNTPMNGAFGATYCAPMWAKFFALALQGQSHPGFATASWTFTPWKGHYATATYSPSSTPSSAPTVVPTTVATPTKTPTPSITPTPPPTPTPTSTPTPTPTSSKAVTKILESAPT